MSFKVIEAGVQSSIQDLGRHGFMHIGVSPGGVMDAMSTKLANWLVGNQDAVPVIEVALVGPKLQALSDMSVAVCGADFSLHVNSLPVATGTSMNLKTGDVLSFPRLKYGLRAYIAVAGEWQIPQVLNGRGTHFAAQFGGLDGRKLCAGDIIPIKNTRIEPLRKLPRDAFLHFTGSYRIRVLPGVEAEFFSANAKKRFASVTYKVLPTSDRMGIRLSSEHTMASGSTSMYSSGLIQGTVQVPPDGQPIVMAADAQTLGGYPRIAHVISVDIPLLGQLASDSRICFEWTSYDSAKALYLQQQQKMDLVKSMLG